MTIEDYIHNLNQRYKLGNATEHTFRGDLQNLIETMFPDIRATNEPKRQKCGAPDYILTRRDVPLGYIEAKDIGDADLSGSKKTGNKEQFDRYKASLNNLIFTDYLTFLFYRDGEQITSIAIGEVTGREIKALPQNFEAFQRQMKDFATTIGQTIKSSKRLAELMAGKARLLSEIIERSLTSDNENHEDSTLRDQMQAFKHILIHDITPKGFADVYAQTITYGLFAARLHDPTMMTFSRQEAAELIPKSNPFLRKLFQYIAGYDLDDRIKWIVDDLVQIFLACNVEEMLKNYGKATKMEDPIIHFYEDFLSEYDPKLRKARGVWYTPQPVVSFIVRSVDEILKTEFGLPQGLADTSKTKVKVDYQGKKIDQEVHKVQILDPATGTGTFLAEVVKHIHKRFEGQEGIWSNYVENHLLPRLNGFELLMASYAMAHLKLDLLLTETGFKPTSNIRFRVYLTNSLEESHPDTGTLFANWLSTEANEANMIKRDTPVMCVVGNPPYSVSSTNKSEWIEKLVADYKRDLNERNIQPLSDDYIKFIRYGQHFIEKNGSGILAYISNNSFLDGIIHRQMRKNLLETFDKIYIIDLHGNNKKKETAPDGSSDQNVFDIMQGVSINILTKTGNKEKNRNGKVLHFDLYGKRDVKYNFLLKNGLKSIDFIELNNAAPNFFFVNKNTKGEVQYEKGLKVEMLFLLKATGIKTQRDDASIKFTQIECDEIKTDFLTLTNEELIKKYNFKDVRDWTINEAKKDLKNNKVIANILCYRPFDFRYMNYTGKTKGVQGYPRIEVMKHFLSGNNLGLILNPQPQAANLNYFDSALITDKITDTNLYRRGGPYSFPLYLYSIAYGQLTTNSQKGRTPNLNLEIVNQIASGLGHVFTTEKEDTPGTFAPIDILDYIYAVLHSPEYREKYKEFLKIDFPRVPYPKDAEKFWKLVAIGSQIRQIHLLESPVVENYITRYPESGDNKVVKPVYKDGRVYINDEQYFDGVPEVAWNFYIGGYQPAQKWLKDRKDRTLEFDDILHYQKIIVALTETDRLMREVDAVGVE